MCGKPGRRSRARGQRAQEDIAWAGESAQRGIKGILTVPARGAVGVDGYRRQRVEVAVQRAVEGEPRLPAPRTPRQETQGAARQQHEQAHAQAGGAQHARVAREGDACRVVLWALVRAGAAVGRRCNKRTRRTVIAMRKPLPGQRCAGVWAEWCPEWKVVESWKSRRAEAEPVRRLGMAAELSERRVGRQHQPGRGARAWRVAYPLPDRRSPGGE